LDYTEENNFGLQLVKSQKGRIKGSVKEKRGGFGTLAVIGVSPTSPTDE